MKSKTIVVDETHLYSKKEGKKGRSEPTRAMRDRQERWRIQRLKRGLASKTRVAGSTARGRAIWKKNRVRALGKQNRLLHELNLDIKKENAELLRSANLSPKKLRKLFKDPMPMGPNRYARRREIYGDTRSTSAKSMGINQRRLAEKKREREMSGSDSS